MTIVKIAVSTVVLVSVIFLAESAAHEYSGHGIKKGTASCLEVKMVGRICFGEVDYSEEKAPQ